MMNLNWLKMTTHSVVEDYQSANGLSIIENKDIDKQVLVLSGGQHS